MNQNKWVNFVFEAQISGQPSLVSLSLVPLAE